MTKQEAIKAAERERKAAVAMRGKLVRFENGKRVQAAGYPEADARVTRAFDALRAAHARTCPPIAAVDKTKTGRKAEG